MMDAYGWFTSGMLVGVGYATLFICTLEALDRRYGWIDDLIDWIADRFPEEEPK